MTNTSTAGARGPFTVFVIAAAGFGLGALAGAYLNWLWWEIGSRPLATILGVAILIVGCIVALIPRGIVRRIGLLILALGFGLLAGQNLGPSREPLISQSGGTMTLRLEAPVVAVATGSADCTNVASETEFSVQGSLDQPPGPLGSPTGISIQLGDRFSYPRDNSRTDRVRLEIEVITELVPGSIKVLERIGMEATETSTLESTFSNEGGSIRFADLAALGGPVYTGESMDLAGTLEWTCGAALP